MATAIILDSWWIGAFVWVWGGGDLSPKGETDPWASLCVWIHAGITACRRRARATKAQDERGVKLWRRTSSAVFLLWLSSAYLAADRQRPLCVASCLSPRGALLGFFLKWPRAGKLPWNSQKDKNLGGGGGEGRAVCFAGCLSLPWRQGGKMNIVIMMIKTINHIKSVFLVLQPIND